MREVLRNIKSQALRDSLKHRKVHSKFPDEIQRTQGLE